MTTQPVPSTVDGGDLFDLGQGKLWVGFVLRSIRRHLPLFLAITAALTVLGGFVTLSAPKSYLSSTRILASNSAPINAITVPNSQGITSSTDFPSDKAEVTIRAEKNLELIVDQLDLVARDEASVSTLGKIRSKLFGLLGGTPSVAEKRSAIVDRLRSSITVETSNTDRQSFGVSLLWNDAVVTQLILQQVAKNYLEDQAELEIGQAQQAVEIAQGQLDKQNEIVGQLRVQLNILETDSRPLPESSPLRGAIQIQSEYQQRLADAQTQVDNTKQGLRFRYRVVTPPELPKAPVSGSLFSLILTGIAACVVAAGVTTLLDIVRGKVVESWQVSRRLNIPVLAELKG